MHTQPRDENGTDLPVVAKTMAPDYKVYFSDQKLSTQQLNYLYNMSDLTINMASNEGFGLGTCESLMAGTPIIVNVTGGLQDQCGFKLNGEFVTYKDYDEIKSFHDDRKWKDNPDLTWGNWVKPIWPSNRSLQGSIPTPYIFDDRCSYEDAGKALLSWYLRGPDERERCGKKAIEFVKDKKIGMDAKHMGERFIKCFDNTFENWKPKQKDTLEAV